MRTLLKGGTGLIASATAEAALPTLEQIQEGSGLITQLVILVVTIIQLFKKKPKQPKI